MWLAWKAYFIPCKRIKKIMFHIEVQISGLVYIDNISISNSGLELINETNHVIPLIILIWRIKVIYGL